MTKGKAGAVPFTAHRGYDIRYSENEEVWECWPLKLSAPKLSTLKGKIDRTLRKINDENGVRAISLQWRGPTDALVVGVKPGRLEWKSSTNKREPGPFRVEWMGTTGAGERAIRHESQITDLALDTPKVREMLREVERLEAAVDQAKEARERYEATIPRLTEADLAGLKPEEDDAEA